jgi:hypothetical protein
MRRQGPYRLCLKVGRILIWLALIVFPVTCLFAYQTEHVILVIIDGLRYTEGLGDPDHTHVPEMYELSLRGAIVEPFMNDGYTVTSRAVPAIWCGAWTEVCSYSGSGCGGGDYTYCELPTVFEYYRKHLLRPKEDCIYALCEVDNVWRGSLDADYGPDYWPLYHSEGTTDLEVWHEAERMLSEHHPSFLLLYLERVDHFGHSGSWSYYTRSIEIADSIVGMLWDFLESDSVYAGKTTVFVTNDHGRHTDDFTTHGCSCTGCRTVQLLAVGPDIKRGFISEVPRTVCDITPTIGELLGFVADKAAGSVMYELLLQPEIEDG